MFLFQVFGKLQVKGVGVSSPYRLRPLVGVRVPLNSSYSPIIYMHNPHTTPIQVSKGTDAWCDGIDLVNGSAVYVMPLILFRLLRFTAVEVRFIWNFRLVKWKPPNSCGRYHLSIQNLSSGLTSLPDQKEIILHILGICFITFEKWI